VFDTVLKFEQEVNQRVEGLVVSLVHGQAHRGLAKEAEENRTLNFKL